MIASKLLDTAERTKLARAADLATMVNTVAGSLHERLLAAIELDELMPGVSYDALNAALRWRYEIDERDIKSWRRTLTGWYRDDFLKLAKKLWREITTGRALYHRTPLTIGECQVRLAKYEALAREHAELAGVVYDVGAVKRVHDWFARVLAEYGDVTVDQLHEQGGPVRFVDVPTQRFARCSDG